jgi:L-aspartate oxidase
MWRDVGIVRDRESLSRAKVALSAWASSASEPTDRESQELADMLTCGRLVTEAALAREESRGAHFRRDRPEPREEWRRRLVWRG